MRRLLSKAKEAFMVTNADGAAGIGRNNIELDVRLE